MVLRQMVWKELQSNKSSERKILSLVHHTHPAAAESLHDPVVRDHSPDQRIRFGHA
jgi:hypothetical protein